MERLPLLLHITNEFEAYLRCGIPACGFLRMTCEGCDQEKVVAFSCKKRMVLSFLIPLRYWMQASSKLFAKVHRVVIHEMRRHYESKAKLAGIKSPKSGCVAFTQRVGSAMTDAEVASLAESISKKVLAILVHAGLLNKEGEVVTNPDSDEIFRDHEALAAASSVSITGKIAFGPNAGRHVTKVGSGFGYYEETPLAKGRLCYSVNGFSLHCNTAVNTHSRDRLLKLKTPWHDGTLHLLLTPSEFLKKSLPLSRRLAPIRLAPPQV